MGWQNGERWRYDSAFKAPLPRLDPPLSREEWIARIERIRFEEAGTICPTCGSTTPPVVETKECRKCHRALPVSSFSRNRTNKDGRQFWCRWCLRPLNAAQAKRRRARLAVAS